MGWFRLGRLELLVVSDGTLRQDAGAVFGLVPRIIWEPYTPDLAEHFEPLSDARQVELVTGDVELATGVRIALAPGHTEDHCIVELEFGGEYALYVGELAQHPVMLERLAWISAFDILPLVSLETKRRFIERAMDQRALLISVHSPYPS